MNTLAWKYCSKFETSDEFPPPVACTAPSSTVNINQQGELFQFTTNLMSLCPIPKVCDAFASPYPVTEVCGVIGCGLLPSGLGGQPRACHASLSFIYGRFLFLILDRFKDLSLFFKIYFYFICMDACWHDVSAYAYLWLGHMPMNAGASKSQKGNQDSRSWSYRPFWATQRGCQNKLHSSASVTEECS